LLGGVAPPLEEEGVGGDGVLESSCVAEQGYSVGTANCRLPVWRVSCGLLCPLSRLIVASRSQLLSFWISGVFFSYDKILVWLFKVIFYIGWYSNFCLLRLGR
jgi:hypothetical protein